MKVYQVLDTRNWAPYYVVQTFLTEDAANRCCADMNDYENAQHLATIKPFKVEELEIKEDY